MNKFSKLLVVLAISAIVIGSSISFAALVPHTVTIINNTSETTTSFPFMTNYTGNITSEKFLIDNISSGVLASSIEVYIHPVWPAPEYSGIPPSANITHNKTLLNSFGPTFTLEATLYQLHTVNHKTSGGTVYGGISLTTNTVSVPFLMLLIGSTLEFPLHAPSINIASGSYELAVSLFVNTSFPIHDSNYSSIFCQLGITAISVNENLNGYLFKQSPTVVPLNVTTS